MFAGQDSIGAWIELFTWFFWVIAFELDQGSNRYPVLGSWVTMISQGFALVVGCSVKGNVCGKISALLCSVSIKRDVV